MNPFAVLNGNGFTTSQTKGVTATPLRTKFISLTVIGCPLLLPMSQCTISFEPTLNLVGIVAMFPFALR